MNKMSKAAKILDRIITVIFWLTLSVTVLCIIGGGLLLFLGGRLPNRSYWPLTTLMQCPRATGAIFSPEPFFCWCMCPCCASCSAPCGIP